MRYFRVAAIKKDDNLRELIIKANDRKSAVNKVNEVKAFLFPNEDTSNYIYNISLFPIEVNGGTTVTYYRITVYRPSSSAELEDGVEFGHDTWEWIESADNKEQAKSILREELLKEGQDPATFDIYADEVFVEKCIEEEEESLKNRIRRQYFFRQGFEENITVREYAKKQKEFEENPDCYYAALKSFNGELRIRKALMKHLDVSLISMAEAEDYIGKLVKAIGSEEYSKIWQSAVDKYGKETV